MMSKSNKAIRVARKAGYRVNRNGVVVRDEDKTRLKSYSHNRREPNQYRKVYVEEAGTWIYVHRLAAYEKFGAQAFSKKYYVGHKNNDGTDNRPSNIILTPREGRSFKSSTRRPITDTDIQIAMEMHQNGYTSCDIAARLIRSPRTCRAIVERLKATEEASA
jgi:hypothetical protein